jgi:glycosyltransferase involved in cell wall biosynthesis
MGLIKLSIENYLSDGIFCISRFLIDFYKERGLDHKKLILLPSTVDPIRFSLKGEKPLPFPYIGYFGGLTFRRDNIDLLVEAFSLITEKYPDIHLVLGGFSSKDERSRLENLISDLNISSKVILLNYLPRDEIIQYITHSDILVMVRGKGIDSQASFPCKLTEYLGTSKPVITVNVGEISDYLVDGINSFLVDPGNKVELAEKLEHVLKDYKSALEVGQKGKQLTETIFNYNYQAKRIISFVETL